MRTIEIPIYNYSDLLLPENKNVLDNIVENWDENYFYIWDESHNSVKSFHNYFGFSSEGNRSWLDFNLNCDDEVEELKGESLKKYLEENFSVSTIFSSCPFTGVYYDEILLTPFRDFLLNQNKYENFENTNLKDLFNDAFYNLTKCIEDEIDYRNSEESILETIESNDYEFYENGKFA